MTFQGSESSSLLKSYEKVKKRNEKYFHGNLSGVGDTRISEHKEPLSG